MKVYVAKTWKRNHLVVGPYKFHKSLECALSCINNGRASRGYDITSISDYKKKLDYFDMGYYVSKGLVPCKKCFK